MYKHAYRSLFRKSSMLRKLLLSMICLICIPLIIIQIFTIQKSTREFTQSQHTQTLSYLQSINASFEEHVDAFSAYSVKIASVEEVKYPLQADIAEYKLYISAKELKEFDSVYPLIKYVGAYYPSTDRVICNGFCYTLLDFVSLYFPTDSASKEAFAQFFLNSQGTGFFATDAYEGKQMSQLLFARSVPIGGGLAENATIFFAIETQSLGSWCSSFLSQSSGFAISLASGDTLLHTGVLTQELLSSEGYISFTANLSEYMYTLNDADDTLIYKYQSPDSDYVIFAAMPQNVINENVNQYIMQVRMALILTFLVTIIFTAVTAYINYKPIVQLLNKHVTPVMEDPAVSELDLLDSAFFLRDEQITTQDNLIMTFLISDLLTGDNVDAKKLERYFPKNEQLHFAVLLTDIIFSTAQTSLMIERAMQMYNINLLITTIPQRKETIFIFCSRKMEDFERREEKLNQVILRTFGFECGFVSGSIVDSVQYVMQSYQEAIQNYYKVTEALRLPETFPTQQIQEFGNCIRRNNLNEASSVLEQIRQKVGRYSTTYQKLIGFDMVRSYINNASQEDVSELESALSSENVPLMFAVLHSSIEKRQCAAQNVSKDINREMKELLTDYVDKNYLDSDMSLTSVADYMKTSIYTVSRLFKEATGMGFKDYITSKRLKYACHLLETTNLSVSAITTECGFGNTAYFSTLFKTEYGVTPSNYRTNR